MAVFGSIDILTQLVGGQQVLNQLQQIRTAGQQIGNQPINVNVNASNLTAFNSNLQNTSRTLTNFSQTWDRSLQGIARFSDGLTHAGQVAATFAYRMTLLTAPIDLLIGKSIQFTTELEYSLAKVGTQLDGTLDQIRRFAAESKAISLDLQTKYGVDARQSAESLYFQVSSGVTQQQAQAALEPLARLAAVTQTSPAIASQALVAALNVFGDELERIPDLAERTAYALEVMFDATRKGRFEFTDFATQFGRAAEQMHMVNATFEETSAMLATLSQVFTPSQASTTLNSFAKAFLNPVEKAKEAFKALKVEMYESVDGRTVRRSFAEVFAETFDKLGQVAAKDQQLADTLMGALFGDLRGGRGAQMLADPRNRQLLKDILAEINAGTDDIGKSWELMSEQIQTAINQTIGMFFKLGDSIVGSLEPTIRGALAGVQVFLTNLTANPQVAQMLGQIAASLAIAAPATLVFATALMGAGGLITALATLMTPAYLVGFAIIVSKLAPAFTAASGAVAGFGGGLKGVLGLITETALQLGLISTQDRAKIFESLGIQAKEIGRNAGSVRDFVSELRKLGDDAKRIGDNIKTIADGIAQLIDNISKGRGVLGWIVGAAGGIANAAGGLLGTASNATGISGSSGIAQVADVAIGGFVAAKIASTLMGVLGKLTVGTQVVTAGVVNVAGLPGQLAGAVAATGPLGIAAVAAVAVAVLGYLGIKAVADRGAQERSEQGKRSNFSDALIQGAQSTSRDYEKWHAEINAAITKAAEDTTRGLLLFLKSVSDAVLASPFDTARNVLRVGIEATVNNIANGIVAAVNNAVKGVVPWIDRNVGPLFGYPYQGAGGFAGPQLLTLSGTANGGVGALARVGATSVDKLIPQLEDTGFQVGAFGDAAKKAADAAREAAEKFRSAIENLVKAALAPTSVTDEDMEATKAGRYMDKPDEFARRTLAVASGTDPSIYGQDYLDQLKLAQSKMPGASFEEIAGAFSDKSLFANMTPEEIDKMWNWDAVVASVRRGIDRIVGEWKLMKQAVGEVMSQLTSDELASLKEALGLSQNTSLEDLTSEFLGKTTGLGKDAMASVTGTIDENTRSLFGDFADLLDRIKANATIVVKIVFDEGLLDAAKATIADLEEKIKSFAPSPDVNRVYKADRNKDDTVYIDLGRGKGEYPGEAAAAAEDVEGQVSPEQLEFLKQLADTLERIKAASNIVIQVAFDNKMWEKAKTAIDEAEAYIKEHLLNYADVFIQITARFSAESGGNKKSGDVIAGGDDSNAGGGGGDYQGRWAGGYVTQGVYRVGEKGEEYVVPNPIVRWMESILGGRIQSPEDFKWLIEGLATGGKNEAMQRAITWAAGKTGSAVELDKNFAKWMQRIKVITGDNKRTALDDYLWAQGNPATDPTRGGGGGGAGGSGTGGSGDLTALKSSFDALISALNHLTRSIDALSRAGINTPQQVADYVGGGGSVSRTNSSAETVNFYGNIIAPNGATVDSLYKSVMEQAGRKTRTRANLGQA